jgi:hypothetical protein
VGPDHLSGIADDLRAAPFRGDEDVAVAVIGTLLQHHDRRRRTRQASGHRARRRRGARCPRQGDARGDDDAGDPARVSRPAPPPVRGPGREGLLRHHAPPPVREVTVMVGPLPPHRPHDTQPVPPRDGQAGDNGPASRTHAGPFTPAMPMHRSSRTAPSDRPVQRAAPQQERSGSRSAPPACSRPSNVRSQAGDQCRTRSGRLAPPADSRGPRHGPGRRQRASQSTSGHPRRH